jgi:Leucine-rich repeat (LRR) protein
VPNGKIMVFNSVYGKWQLIVLSIIILLLILVGLLSVSYYHQLRLEQQAIARLQELDADFGRAISIPYFLARVFQFCRLPLPTSSIGSINDVGSAFCDEDMALLRNCTRISNLDLDRTQISDAGLFYLRNFDELTILELDETKVTDTGLIHLTELPKLRVVTLENTQISDAGLKHLAQIKSITWIDVKYTNISDVGIAHLSRLPRLSRVDLEGTGVTQMGINRLKENKPDLKINGP